jgi:hypothetical protein
VGRLGALGGEGQGREAGGGRRSPRVEKAGVRQVAQGVSRMTG